MIHLYAISSSQIRFPFSLPNFFFLAYTQTTILKPLTVGSSSWKLNTMFWTHFLTFPPLGFDEIMSVVKEMSFVRSSYFPAYTQTCHSKTMISNLLTVRSLWNSNTRFETHFRTSHSWNLRNNVYGESNVSCTKTVKRRLQSLILLSNAWKS